MQLLKNKRFLLYLTALTIVPILVSCADNRKIETTPTTKISKENSSEISTSMTLKTEESTLPTGPNTFWNYDELVKHLNNNFNDLGSCQIVTVFFEDKNQVILENDKGVQIETALSIEKQSDLTFNLIDTNPVAKNLKVGDYINVIQSNDKLYLYQ